MRERREPTVSVSDCGRSPSCLLARHGATVALVRFAVLALAVSALTVGALVGARAGIAQDDSADTSLPTMAPDYRWAHFVQHAGGMMSNDVWAVVATDAAVWVGTDLGMSYYDGAWVNFMPEESELEEGAKDAAGGTTVPTGTVLALAVGEDGFSILAGTENGLVYLWDGEAWQDLAEFSESVLSLVEVNDSILVGTESGVVTVDESDGSTVSLLEGMRVFSLFAVDDIVYAGTDTGLWRLVDSQWEAVAMDHTRGQGVYAISAYAGGLALGTADGVVLLDERLEAVRNLPATDELGRDALVQALAADTFGTLWAGTDGAGAIEFSADTYEIMPHGQAHDANVTIRYVRDVAVDADGSIWFATPTGVYRYQVGMWHADVQGSSVADPLNHVNDLLVASDGALWIATGGAGVRMKSAMDGDETVFGLDADVPSTVLTLAEDSQDRIWAGTFYGLFRYEDGEWTLPVVNERLPNLTITALLYVEPNLWIGTEGGLAMYDMAGSEVETIEAFEGESVEALALDGLGRVWAGTRSQGAWLRQEDGAWDQHVHDAEDEHSIPGNFVINGGLAADWRTPGHVWALVSREGLVHWNGKAWRREDADNQIPVNLLWMLESESDPGRLWIGSEGGVTQFDGETWGTLSQDDGLQSATAYAIERAHDGGHWIGGATGLTYYRPDGTPPWVRVDSTSGGRGRTEQDGIRLPYGEELSVSFNAGDLQTQQQKLHLMRRLVRAVGEADSARTAGEDEALTAAWVEDTPGTWTMAASEPGMYELQLLARDQSFNYSDVLRLPIEVYSPPPTVDVPGLGPVDPTTFGALMILGVVSALGTGFVLFELMKQRTRSVEALNRGFNPYISGEPVRTQEMFFGRRDLVQRIADTLHNNSVMIHGERRIGKTTLLYQLTSLLRSVEDPEYWFVPVYVDLEGTRQHDFFHLLIEEIVLGVLRLPNARDELLPDVEGLEYRSAAGTEYDDRAFNRDLRHVIDMLREYGQLHQAGKQLRLILLLDEMDVMSRYDSIVQQQLRRIFMREFASTVGAVVAGILISKEWDRIESPWYNMFNEIALEPFTEEEANALLIEPVAGYYRYDDEALAFILARSEGRPYRVQQYGLEAVNHMLAQRRRKICLGDAEEAHMRISSAPDVNGLPAGEPAHKPDSADANGQTRIDNGEP